MSLSDFDTDWKSISHGTREILVRISIHSRHCLEVRVWLDHLPGRQREARCFLAVQAIQQEAECIPTGVIDFIDD